MPTLSIPILPSLVLISHFVHPLPLSDGKNQWDSNQVDLSYLGSRVFSQPDEETGRKVGNWDPSRGNPEELGEYAEGDIVFPSSGRNGLVAVSSRWKDGVVPYEIAGSFTAKDLEIINKAMEIYKKYTCITFRPKTKSDTDYVSIVNGNSGCWSSVGRVRGKQEVNLQSPSCTTKVGTTLHELMHAIGFLHEQNRFERDDYVSIAWKNIKMGHEGNFKKAGKGETTGYGVPYDYRSVMHYSASAFSSNGQPTIVPKDAVKSKKMGQRDGFSKGDITKINAMYNCPEKTLEVTKGNSSLENVDNNNNNLGTGEKEHTNPLIDAASGILSFFFNK